MQLYWALFCCVASTVSSQFVKDLFQQQKNHEAEITLWKKTTLGFKSKGDFHLLFDFNRNSTRWDIAVIFVPIAVFFLFGKHWGFCYFFDIEMDPNNFQHLLVTAASSTIHPFIGYLFSSNSDEVSRLFDNFVFHFNEIYSNCSQAWTKRVASISSKWKIYRC